jgi:mono/diheme cytochrome c family protein
MRWRWLLLLAVFPLLATCRSEDMYQQDKAVTWSSFFPFRNHMTMQAPVAGTVARNAPDVPVPQPPTITAAMLARGHQRYDIYCLPCHGASGDGEGMIVQRSFPKPPALFKDELVKAKAQHFYDVITNGTGVMFSYADRVRPADRWAIIAYIRALQRSQRAEVASLPEADKTRLEEAGP